MQKMELCDYSGIKYPKVKKPGKRKFPKMSEKVANR